MTRKASCGAAGIDLHTLINWMDRGSKATSGEYFTLFTSVTLSEAEGLARMEKVWIEAATGKKAQYDLDGKLLMPAIEPDWRAAKEYASRRHRDEWGDKVDVSVDGPMNVNVTFDSKEDAKKL